MTAGRIGMSGAILIVSGIVALAMAQEHRTDAAPQHVVLTPDQLKWSDQMPPGLPAGVGDRPPREPDERFSPPKRGLTQPADRV